MRRRSTFGFALGWLAAGLAGAQAQDVSGRRWAALSLIGDKLTVVGYAPGVGSHLDSNRRDSIPLRDAALDKEALGAVTDALSAALPGAPVALLLAQSPEHYEGQAGLLGGDVAKVHPDLAAAVRATGATHLVLVAKRRAETRLQAASTRVGGGWLEGLGFYVDRGVRVMRSDTGDLGVGFLAPYVYLNVAVIEAGTLRVATVVPVMASTMLSAAGGNTNVDAWDVLSPVQKVDLLRRMVRREVASAVAAAIRQVAAPK